MYRSIYSICIVIKFLNKNISTNFETTIIYKRDKEESLKLIKISVSNRSSKSRYLELHPTFSLKRE